MAYTPPPHTPYPWQNAPSSGTPLDAAHLESAENDLIGYTQSTINSYDAYVDATYAKASTTGNAVTPEDFGAGYNGSASDDWGPAITAAIAEAAAQGVDVALGARGYGCRTGVTYPTNIAWAQAPSLLGHYGKSSLYKLADCTLLNVGGTSTSDMLNGGLIANIMLNGGNNSAWTQPLFVNNFTEDGATYNLFFQDNYGPAISSRVAWDWRHFNPSIFRCGGTDGATPAVYLYEVEPADAGNEVNNQWFICPRIEDWRSGAFWCLGGGLNKIVGTAKFELSNNSPYWGPAIKLQNCSYFSMDSVQITNGGTPAAGQATPVDAVLYMSGCSMMELGRIHCYINGTPSSGQTRSLFNFDGTTIGANVGVSYDIIDLDGFGNGATSTFLWSGTNKVTRGRTAWRGTPTSAAVDSGAPTTVSGTMRYAKFTANGTWTIPPSTTQVRIRAIGGGGGGGGGASTGTAGNGSAGGGAAGTVIDQVQSLNVADTSLTISIGNGGTGGTGGNGGTNPGTDGGTGGTTTVNGTQSSTGYVSAPGGSPGKAGSSTVGNGSAGLYGTGSAVTKSYGTSTAGSAGSGGVGQWGTTPDAHVGGVVGGGGGGSASGTNGGTGGSAQTNARPVVNQFSGSQGGSATTAGANGTTSTVAGCGGGGGGAAFGAQAGAGGAGAAGSVEIWW